MSLLPFSKLIISSQSNCFYLRICKKRKNTTRQAHEAQRNAPSLTRFSLKRLLRMDAERLPLASRIPVSMASLLRSDSVKPLRNSSSCQRANIETQSCKLIWTESVPYAEIIENLNWTRMDINLEAVLLWYSVFLKRHIWQKTNLFNLLLKPFLQVFVAPDELVKDLKRKHRTCCITRKK